MKKLSTVNYLRSNWSIPPTNIKYFCPQIKVFRSHPCGCNKPIISIVTSVKNREVEFEKMLDSLRQQRLRELHMPTDLEHVVVDSKYTEGRLYLLGMGSEIHTKYIFGEDTSLYDGFNVGWRNAMGDLVCYLNSDDWYERDYIESAYKLIRYSKGDWVFGNCFIHDENGNLLLIHGRADYMLKPWLNFSRFHHTTVMARKHVFDRVGDFPDRLHFLGKSNRLLVAADYWWFMRAQQLGFFGVWHHEVYGHMHNGGISHNRKMRKRILFEGFLCAWNLWPSKRVELTIVWFSRGAYDFLARNAPPGLKRILYRLVYSLLRIASRLRRYI
jgi:glycosyltransferase involved in cell wall biosynthesis